MTLPIHLHLPPAMSLTGSLVSQPVSEGTWRGGLCSETRMRNLSEPDTEIRKHATTAGAVDEGIGTHSCAGSSPDGWCPVTTHELAIAALHTVDRMAGVIQELARHLRGTVERELDELEERR